MKKRLSTAMGLLVTILFAVVGCSATPAEIQEAIEQVAPTLQVAATELAPTVEATDTSDETSAESGESADEHTVMCDIADIPPPTQAEATVRFANGSGGEISVKWRDTSSSPPQLVEYARLADGGTFDQETFAGHEWVLEDHDRNTLEYVVSAETQQCVVLHHWGYEGEVAPANWAELRDNYETCGIGQHQSPIDLTNVGMADLENIVFEYGETAVTILNNGHTVQVDKVENSQIVLSDVTYPLVQFHFHAPSEHTEGSEHYPIEMHLVHRLANGDLAVVGVFITQGAENSAFAPVWDHLPEEETEAIATGATVDVAALLPTNRQFYAYSGSLTTPPCSENVKWMVMNDPVEMSAEQIAVFTDIFSGNNRPLQSLNERDVELDESP